MSFAYSPTQPVATGSSVASAPVNSAFSQVGGAFNQHVSGSAYAHQVAAGTGGVAVTASVTGITAAATGATDLWTMLDRLANAIGIVESGSGASAGSWASGLSGVSAAGGVGQATSSATNGTLARRDPTTAGIAFGPLSATNIIGVGSDSAHAGVYARGAAGDPTQVILSVQNNAGNVINYAVDNLGNSLTRGRITGSSDMVITSVIWAGSGTTQVTDAVGKVNLAALPIVDRAHGGFGLDMTNSSNFATMRSTYSLAESGANTTITSLGGLTTALGSAYGGTGLVSPAAGSIPVTNGSGNWQLLPPTPANYFVVSNGTTYVAQAFTTSMIPSGSLNQSVMSSLYPSAGTGGGNLLKAQAQAWAGFINGTWVSFAGGIANYSPAIDPTGIALGQSRIDLLVLNAAGNLAWSVGTPSATPSIAATPLPTSTAPIWYVKVYNGATSITGYTDTGSQAAFIQDARNLFGPTSVAAGGGGGYLTGHYATLTNETATLANSTNIAPKPFVTIGTDTDLTAETDLFALGAGNYIGVSTVVNTKDLANFVVHPGLSRRAIADSSLDDVQQNWIQPDIGQRISKSSSTTVLLSASAGQPLSIRNKKVIASSSATASGSAGPRYVVFDTGTSQLVTPMPTVNNPTVTGVAIPLATYWWDGTALQDSTFVDLSGLGTLATSAVSLVSVPLNDTGVISAALPTTGGWTTVPNVPAVSFYVPVACKCRVMGRFIVTYVAAGTAPGLFMALSVDGSTTDLADIAPVVGTETRTLPILPISTYHYLTPGLHTFSAQYFNLAGVGSTVTILANGCQAVLDIYKA